MTIGPPQPTQVIDTPSAFLIAPPAPQLPVVVSAAQLDVAGKQSIAASTDGLRAMHAAQRAHAAFDTNTAAYGNTQRMGIARWMNTWGNAAMNAGIVTLMAGGIATGLVNGVGVASIGCGLIAAFGGTILGVVGVSSASALQVRNVRGTPLSGDKVEPLRRAFDEAPPRSLERAVLAELAGRYKTDLTERSVRGDAAYAVLRDIIDRGEELPAQKRSTAKILVDCFEKIRDVRGAPKALLDAKDVKWIENALSFAEEPAATELKGTLKAMLFDGDLARQKMDFKLEGRLYRVLAGIEAPHRVTMSDVAVY